MKIFLLLLAVSISGCRADTPRKPYGFFRDYVNYKNLEKCPHDNAVDRLVWHYWRCESLKRDLESFAGRKITKEDEIKLNDVWYQLNEAQIGILDALMKPKRNNNEIDLLLNEIEGLGRLYLTLQGLG